MPNAHLCGPNHGPGQLPWLDNNTPSCSTYNTTVSHHAMVQCCHPNPVHVRDSCAWCEPNGATSLKGATNGDDAFNQFSSCFHALNQPSFYGNNTNVFVRGMGCNNLKRAISAAPGPGYRFGWLSAPALLVYIGIGASLLQCV